MKSRLFYQLIAAVAFLCLNVGYLQAQITPRWIQQPAISPDGAWIAFEYQGKVWKVPSNGGTAIPLTDSLSYSGYPVWSHDSKSIAYASDKYGNFDVYLINAYGGTPKRLTTDSRRDIPQDFSANDSSVFFLSARQNIFTSVRFPSSSADFLNLYQVAIRGGKSILLSNAGMAGAQLHKNGDLLLFQDVKGGENTLRKHHTSSVTRDIWTYSFRDMSYKKVSSFQGEDLNPVWGDGEDIYYLSERSGSFNVYKGSIKDSLKLEQITSFKDNPVRNLSRSSNGRLAFTYNGDIYTIKPGAEPSKIKVVIKAAPLIASLKSLPVKGEISEVTVSQDGRQIAFISRGELFVSSADGDTTARLTSTPYQERMPAFSPDGKKLLYSVERNHSWDIEQFTLNDAGSNYFYNKPKMIHEALIATDEDEFQGVYSPDGNQIAYLENRDLLKSYNIHTKKTQRLLPDGINYSNNDGDQYFRWSPDSQYLLMQSKEGATGSDNEVILIKNDGSCTYTNLTKSGFKDEKPLWSKSGKMIYWLTDRDAYRNFTEDSYKDVYAMYFDSKPALNGEGELERKRLTGFSGNISTCAISPDESKLFYMEREGNGYDLKVIDLKSNSSTTFVKLQLSDPKMEMTKDGHYLFILDGGNIIKINLDSAQVQKLNINATVDVDLAMEQRYIFDHIYRLIKKRFMYPDLIVNDLDRNYANYKQFVQYITNDYDFTLMVNEFLGELNTSHTDTWLRTVYAHPDETGALGLLYDESRKEKGLLVKEVIGGGPFDITGSKMKANMIIDGINGVELNNDNDWSSALNHQSGKPTRISFHDAMTGSKFEETVVPVSLNDEKKNLLYRRWVRRMEKLTDSLSGGKIGYVHVRTMNDAGMRNMYEKALGKYRNAEALIVDTRFNGGGSLHDELTTFLNGKIYLTENRQNRVTPLGEPFKKWTKPSIMLISEANYSDAYLTPYTYRLMGIGKLVGMPVAGSGTASQGEFELNKNIGFHFATAATYFRGNSHANENFQLEPDITVLNEYDRILKGDDQQLKRAVEEMLNLIKK